jgi:hypothetical protein
MREDLGAGTSSAQQRAKRQEASDLGDEAGPQGRVPACAADGERGRGRADSGAEETGGVGSRAESIRAQRSRVESGVGRSLAGPIPSQRRGRGGRSAQIQIKSKTADEEQHESSTTAAARMGTGDGDRGDLMAAVTSRGPVGTETLKPALIPC